jgi:hypothetical protein
MPFTLGFRSAKRKDGGTFSITALEANCFA